MADENEAQTAALAHVSNHCPGLGRDARALAAVAEGFMVGARWAQEQQKASKRQAEPSPASSPEGRAFANWLRTSPAAPSCTINGHDACWADAIRWERERNKGLARRLLDSTDPALRAAAAVGLFGRRGVDVLGALAAAGWPKDL